MIEEPRLSDRAYVAYSLYSMTLEQHIELINYLLFILFIYFKFYFIFKLYISTISFKLSPKKTLWNCHILQKGNLRLTEGDDQ